MSTYPTKWQYASDWDKNWYTVLILTIFRDKTLFTEAFSVECKCKTKNNVIRLTSKKPKNKTKLKVCYRRKE